MKKNDKLLEYIRRKEYKRRLDAHEVWGHVGGKFYTLTKILFTIGFVLTELVNITYLVFGISRYATQQDRLADPGQTRNAILVVAIGSILLITAYILLVKRRPIGYLVCTILPSALLPLHFYNEMTSSIAENGIQNYLFKHALWYGLMVASILVLAVIQFRENIRENREYARTEAELYKRASRKSDTPFTEADWAEVLAKYGDKTGLVAEDAPAEDTEKEAAQNEKDEA